MERDDSTSILHLYRELIRLRRVENALTIGSSRLERANDDILLYRRESDGHRLSIALNFSSQPRILTVQKPGRILLSTYLDRRDERFDENLTMRGHEGVIAENIDSRTTCPTETSWAGK